MKYLSIFKNLFQKNEYKIVRKNFKGGYFLDDPAMIQKCHLFIKRAQTDFNIKDGTFSTHPDWKKFSAFISATKKFYYDNARTKNLKEILELEKSSYSVFWNRLSKVDKNKISALIETLDKE